MEYLGETATIKLEDEDQEVESSAAVGPSFIGHLDAFRRETFLGPRRNSQTSPAKNASPSSPPSRKRPPAPRASSSSAKRRKTSSSYAPPSTYAHLPELRDTLAPNLLTLFVGLNPGIKTSQSGHAYAHPSNLFWRLLHSSGCTTRRCSPTEDGDLPQLFHLGNTNIVSRPTKNGSELSKKEMDENVGVLDEKIKLWRPESVCFVGKSIWESVWRVRHGRVMTKEQFRYGWQDDGENIGAVEGNNVGKRDEEKEGMVEGWNGARVFVATSTSGLAATTPLAEKQRIWRELGSWVEQRRKERSEVGEQVMTEE